MTTQEISRRKGLTVEPKFETAAEKSVWRALRDALQPGEILIHGMRFSDAVDGDVEADFILLLPGHGIAVIEVKGGLIQYENGEWTTSRGNYSRRIHPIEQARKAKHALRRFISRQPGWSEGLPKAEWFVAFPQTEVQGDMGPEGRRDLILGEADISNALAKIRKELDTSTSDDRVITTEDADSILQMLLGIATIHGLDVTFGLTPTERKAKQRLKVAKWSAAIIALLAVGALTVFAMWWLHWPGLAIVLLIVSPILAFLLAKNEIPPISANLWARVGINFAAAILTVCAGVFVSNQFLGPSAFSSDCHAGYSPCIPIVEDLDCSEIREVVRVLGGDDPYKLDADANGTGCESYRK